MTIHLTATERPLSPTEFVVWAADEAASINFAMHCEVFGEFTESQLRAALAQIQQRHPLLRMRLAAEGAQAWFRTGGVGPLPLRIVDAPPERLAAEAEHEVQTRFQCETGPLARCVWIRHAPGHGTLLLTFQHVIGDGTSGAFLIRDLLSALAGATLPALPLAESLDGHLPPAARGLRGLFGYLGMLSRTVGWTLRRGRPVGLPTETRAPFAEQRARLLCMRFETEVVDALTRRARAEGTTIHGALSAAIVLAGYPELGEQRAHVLFGAPINLRERLVPPVGGDVGFYVTGAYSSHVVDARTTFWPLAREIKQGLNAAIDAGAPYFGLNGLAPGLMWLRRAAGGGDRGTRLVGRTLAALMQDSFNLTNIGRVNIATHYGDLRIHAVGFLASPSVFCDSLFFAASHDGILTVNFAAMEPVISPATQQRVTERLRALLLAAIESPSAGAAAA